MAGNDFTDNDVNSDPLNQYRAIFGVPSRRRIIFVAACVFFVLTLIVIAFALMSRQDNSPSKTVKLSYALIRNAIDVSADPCVDFYNFTCGLWAQNNPINQYLPRVTTFSLLQDDIDLQKKTIFENAKPSNDFPRIVNTAIHFYSKCVQTNNTNTSDRDLLVQYLDQIGGWPILNEYKWNESSFDLLQNSAFLIRTLDIHSFIGVYSTDSDKSGGRNVIYLKAPTLLKDEDLLHPPYIFQQMIYSIAQSLNNSEVNMSILGHIDNLHQTVTKFRELLTLPSQVSVNPYMSIEDLSTLIPDFDWLKYIQLVTNDTLLKVNETLTLHDVVAVENINYLKKVVSVINSEIFSKRDLADLLGWLVVKSVWLLIPGALQRYADLNQYDAEDVKRVAANGCYDLVLELFPCSLDYIYVKNTSHAGIKDNKILTDYLKLAFQDIILRSHWIDDISKDLILHRISNMKNIIGFPSYLNNKTEFDALYKDFPTLQEYSLGCYIQATQFYVTLRTLQIKVTVNQLKAILPRRVSDVSAYYIVHQNSLVYPISLHNPPFYYPGGPWYLNFGGIGSVIGHEMMHSIDCTGVQGNDLNVSWFSNESRTLYKEHASCFKDQYSVYDHSGVFKNNGTRTLRENIADTEGLHLAFEAYKKHQMSAAAGHDEKYETLDNYTPDQMFFIAYGTVWCAKIKPSIKEELSQFHSLNDIRVNKAVSNSDAFAQAFSCPKGSPMNPLMKCAVW